MAKDYSKFKIGATVKIDEKATGLPSSFRAYVGKPFRITSFMGASGASASAYMDVSCVGVPSLYSLGYTPYCKFFVLSAQTKEDIQMEIKSLEDEIKELQTRIDYIDELGLEEYDENQWKVYKTLKLLDDKTMSKVEKSKIIAQMIS